MKEHGMIFQGWGVRAILAGLKTQTRRLKLRGEWDVGDRIWVKETWKRACGHDDDHTVCIAYRASQGSGGGLLVNNVPWTQKMGAWIADAKWRSSMLMPRYAARVLLEITALREEPLQDISDDDARAEGVAEYAKLLPDHVTEGMSRADAYRHCIESINGPGTWDRNDGYQVITFSKVSSPS